MFGRVFVLASALIAVIATSAHAQNLDAEQLFRLGKKLMKEKKYDEACVAFDASLKAEANTTTLAQLGNCRELNGQLATAWGVYLQLVSSTKNDAKQSQLNATMRARADALESRLSTLSIRTNDLSHRIAGLEISRDGVMVDRALLGTELPVDGGLHSVTARAPGFVEWTGTVEVAVEGDHQRIEIPALEFQGDTGAGDANDAVTNGERMDAAPPPRWRSNHQGVHMGVSLGAMMFGGGNGVVAGRVTVATRARRNIEPRFSGAVLLTEIDNGPDGFTWLIGADAMFMLGERSTFGLGLVLGIGPLSRSMDEFGNGDHQTSGVVGVVVTPFSIRFGAKNGSELGAVVFLLTGTDESLVLPLLNFTQFFR